MSNFTNRAMLGQYKISEASGTGGVSWENGIKCVLPKITVPADSISTYRLVGKNLFCPYWYTDGRTETINGVTFTGNADGSITVNGTASENAIFHLEASSIQPLQSRGFYISRPFYISGAPSGASFSTYVLCFNYYSDTEGGTRLYKFDARGTGAFVNDTGKFAAAYIMVYAGVTCDNLIFRPQIEYGNIKTEYEPFYDSGMFTASTLSNTQLIQPNGIGNIIEYPDGVSVNYTGNKGTQIDAKYLTHS